jgi:hypothetical protein
MKISPFFLQLHSAYQAELDDLTFDSEGRDVLKRRLDQKRQELDFLLQMMDLSPEMVAVVFHHGFRFQSAPAMQKLLALDDDDEFPAWDTLAQAAQMTPWAHELAEIFLCQPTGEKFMAVAAALEFMHARVDAAAAQAAPAAEEEDVDNPTRGSHRHDDDGDNDTDEDAPSLEEAGADWMADQGFDRKD